MDQSTFDTIVWIWIAMAFVVVPLELKITAPYGRHSKESWGPMISNKLAWVIMELPSMLIVLSFFLRYNLANNAPIFLFVALWCVHYVNRAVIFPLRQKTKGKKMPVAIMLFAVFFNVMNGWVNGYYFAHFATYDVSWFTDARFIIGMTVFVIGFIINNHSDTILLNLRKPGETGYKIPQGGMFKFVSCPNHFGEIIEWLGFACMVWSLPGLAFAVWTMANLIPRALAHHKWYLERFGDYPRKRKAVIPFVL